MAVVLMHELSGAMLPGYGTHMPCESFCGAGPCVLVHVLVCCIHMSNCDASGNHCGSGGCRHQSCQDHAQHLWNSKDL